MQVLLDSLRGALGFTLIFAAIGIVVWYVMIIDAPPREQFEAYLVVRERQITIMFGGMLMLITISGIVIFTISLFRS